MKCYYVQLVRERLNVMFMEPYDDEVRLFSSMDKVEMWLAANGFVYGQRDFFNYPTGDREWFHRDDVFMEHVDVIIEEMEIDDSSKSKYKDLKEMHKEWPMSKYI